LQNYVARRALFLHQCTREGMTRNAKWFIAKVRIRMYTQQSKLEIIAHIARSSVTVLI